MKRRHGAASRKTLQHYILNSVWILINENILIFLPFFPFSPFPFLVPASRAPGSGSLSFFFVFTRLHKQLHCVWYLVHTEHRSTAGQTLHEPQHQRVLAQVGQKGLTEQDSSLLHNTQEPQTLNYNNLHQLSRERCLQATARVCSLCALTPYDISSLVALQLLSMQRGKGHMPAGGAWEAKGRLYFPQRALFRSFSIHLQNTFWAAINASLISDL